MGTDGPKLVSFTCKTHGKLLETFPTATVWCGKCGKAASPPDYVLAARKRRRDSERKARRKGPGQSVAQSPISPSPACPLQSR